MVTGDSSCKDVITVTVLSLCVVILIYLHAKAMFITVLFIRSRIIVVRIYCTYVSHLVTIGTRDHSGEMYGKGKRMK